MHNKSYDLIVIGAGAAGVFGAVNAALANPDLKIAVLERSRQVLSKVRISGGGRCNVTHSCFNVKDLVKNYPRGERELIGPFMQFNPSHTIKWFEKRGVKLKTEEDGRMFPVTDSSETIIFCLMQALKELKIDLLLGIDVLKIEKEQSGFKIALQEESLEAKKILLASGSHPKGHELARSLGHTVSPPVPSLFTFNVPQSDLLDLAGISVDPVEITIIDTKLKQRGPLLITHWGFSGPAVIKLSAWGARILHDMHYKAHFLINWAPDLLAEQIKQYVLSQKGKNPHAYFRLEEIVELPKNLAKRLLIINQIPEGMRYADLSNKILEQLISMIRSSKFTIEGKTTYKQEFVTCGGVTLKEINFKAMESRICPGLFFAGEILDIDGITGGFNFQNAWTTSWIAAQHIGQ